jgi:putative autoinducer-2 (AI-2) aldolase
MASGDRLAEQVLEVRRAVQQGSAVIAIGGNTFCSAPPAQLIQVLSKLVHDDRPPAEAYEYLQALATEPGRLRT